MRVNRTEWLQTLESTQPGLAPREIVEQSSCFIFENGSVRTFNDEVAASAPSLLDKTFTGAVKAEPLLAVLRKLVEDEIDVSVAEGELRIDCKRRKAGITLEASILLPGVQEEPKEWGKLPPAFGEAVDMAQQCSSKDNDNFDLTCVHVHPKWVEGCDTFQLVRYKIKTPIANACLVRHTAIKAIVPLGMTQVAETKSWLHFKNEAGLVLSCRRYEEAYRDTSSILAIRGDPAKLPKGLAEAADRAEIFSAENDEDNQITVELTPGRLRMIGEGMSGWYSESKKVKYDGKPLKFLIAPKILAQLVTKYADCEISDKALRVDGGSFVYLTCLGAVEADGKVEEEERE